MDDRFSATGLSEHLRDELLAEIFADTVRHRPQHAALETLERIYIGRRFKNDTERLEKLFELYTKMTAEAAKRPSLQPSPRKRGAREHTLTPA